MGEPDQSRASPTPPSLAPLPSMSTSTRSTSTSSRLHRSSNNSSVTLDLNWVPPPASQSSSSRTPSSSSSSSLLSSSSSSPSPSASSSSSLPNSLSGSFSWIDSDGSVDDFQKEFYQRFKEVPDGIIWWVSRAYDPIRNCKIIDVTILPETRDAVSKCRIFDELIKHDRIRFVQWIFPPASWVDLSRK